jgi:sulfatase maturation enzyme AslB (radical SAM superfamily)
MFAGMTSNVFWARVADVPGLGRLGAAIRPRTQLNRLRAFVRRRRAPIEVPSEAAGAGQLMAALKAADERDVYWSNEYFYRWLNAADGQRADFDTITATDRRFVVRTESLVDATTKEQVLHRLSRDGRFPGAAVALARWVARSGRLGEALDLAKHGLAAARRARATSGIHVLENQVTALERTIAGKPVHRALRRYLGDDDRYLEERTCPFPFERIDIQENGNASVCCAQWMAPGFSIGNIMRGDSASAAYNSEQAVAVRRSVLDGSFRHCDLVKCPWIAADRLPRKDEVKGRNARRAIDAGRLRFERPSYVVLAFDASCNLSCPSCRVRVITEKATMQIEKEELIESTIMPLLRDVERLNIDPAGEVFVSRPLRRLLSKLNRKDFPNLTIEIISNGTLFTPREWAKFPGIHDMVESVRVSTDGATKATFEKLRRGARWEPFIENMRFLANLRQSNVIGLLQFSLTYQLDNFREMPAFVDLCRSLDPAAVVIFEKLENWGTFAAEEYARRAVHIATHPLHEEFLSIIRAPKLRPSPPLLTADYAGLL